MNTVACLFLLTGFPWLGGCDAFQSGANNNRAAAPTFVTARIGYKPHEYTTRIRHCPPSTHRFSSPSSKLYSSLPNDVADSVALEEVPPNIAWLNERFNFSEEVLKRIADKHRDLLTLDQSVLVDRANWLQKRLTMNNEDLGSIIRKLPSTLTYRPDTNLGPKFDYLQERLALNTKALSKMIQKQPSMLRCGVTQTLEPKLAWIQKRLRLNETKALQKYVAQVPDILSRSIDDNLEPKLSWLQERLNMTEIQIAKVCTKAPQILTSNVDKNLTPTLNWLEQRLDLDQTQLSTVVRKAPVILLCRVENLEDTLQWLQQRLCLDDASLRKFVIRMPTIINCSPSTNLEPTLQWLQEQLFVDQDKDIGKLVETFPSLLAMSIKTNLEPTLDFFKACIGDNAAVELVLRSPAVLGYSLEKRLKPRLEQAQEYGIELDAGCLQRMAQLTEEKWYKSLDYQEEKLAKSKAKDLLW